MYLIKNQNNTYSSHHGKRAFSSQQQNAEGLIGDENVWVAEHMTGSTDTGDLSHIMPVSHPWIGSVRGGLHG
ncbi:hypothetical protein Q4R52_20155, partial [Morganella morganii]